MICRHTKSQKGPFTSVERFGVCDANGNELEAVAHTPEEKRILAQIVNAMMRGDMAKAREIAMMLPQ